jgi:hypothetical protein
MASDADPYPDINGKPTLHSETEVRSDRAAFSPLIPAARPFAKLPPSDRIDEIRRPRRACATSRYCALHRRVVADERAAGPDSPILCFGIEARKPLSSMALEMVMRQRAIEATVQGFRSAFRDWVGERTAFPREIAEAALAHRVGDQVEFAYWRGDALEKRRALMEGWADSCDRSMAS